MKAIQSTKSISLQNFLKISLFLSLSNTQYVIGTDLISIKKIIKLKENSRFYLNLK